MAENPELVLDEIFNNDGQLVAQTMGSMKTTLKKKGFRLRQSPLSEVVVVRPTPVAIHLW
jgi:hypothetical protein